jgi:F-type H+-transporting ATPase subunit b
MAVDETPVARHPTAERAAENDAAHLGQSHTTETTEPSGGLPQFQFQHWPGQIAYLLVLFVILYLLMDKVFAPRVRKIFDERARTIGEAIASAKQVQAEAAAQAEAARAALDASRASAQKTAADAKAKVQEEAKARQTSLEAELSAKLAEAETRIRASRDLAMASVGQVATDTAAAIVEKLTGAPAPEAALTAALAEHQG